MTLTIEEITFLCLIQNLTRLPGFLNFNMLSKEQSDQAIQSLMKKHILNKDKLLTDAGLSLSKTLSLYINAKVYYKFGKKSIFANYRNKEYVMITFNDNCYSIDLVNQDQIVLILLSKLHNLKDVKDGNFKKKLLLMNRFNQFVEENKDVESIFYYKVDLENKSDVKGVLFIDEGYFKSYDIINEEVSMYPRQLIQEGIESIFG